MTKITLKNLTIKREKQVLFDQVDYEFRSGNMILLMGDTGSGKSTLFYLLAGLSSLKYQGNIELDNADYKDLQTADIIKKVGMVFQNPSQQFTMKTLRREIYFSLENHQVPIELMNERVALATKEAKVEHLLDQKLNTLSGGEKQRAALAVLLAMRPEVILLDEPFASVDPKSRKQLIQVLKELSLAGKIIIITDHDQSDYAEVIDEFIVLQGQKLIKQELSLLTNKPPYYRLTNPNASQEKVLALAGVSLAQKNKKLIKQTDLTFKKGITTITGPNGCGKSTCLQALVQQHRYKGKMFYRDKRLRKRRYIYRWLTLIVQEATKQYVAVTVDKELAFSPPKEEKAILRLEKAIKDLGMDKWMKRSVYQLSGGQQKVLQLVTMLSLEVPLLLLDEPFTGLDAATCQYFMEWIKELSAEKDFIIVSHRLAPLDGISDHHIEIRDYNFYQVEDQVDKEAKINE